MELDSAIRETRKLGFYVRDALVVEQNLARVMVRRMYGDVKRRKSILEYALNVALLHIRESREVPVRERESIVVVPNIERLAKACRQALDETELAAIRTPPYCWRLERDPQRFTVQPLELVDDLLTVRLPSFNQELFVSGEKFPVEEVSEWPPVDGE